MLLHTSHGLMFVFWPAGLICQILPVDLNCLEKHMIASRLAVDFELCRDLTSRSMKIIMTARVYKGSGCNKQA